MPASDEHKARVLAHMSSAPAAIRATFSEWRMIKGRKVLQLICEVPLEAQDDVWKSLGSPMPDTDIWVAIARLRDGAALQAEPPGKSGSLAQKAGILCNEGAFNTWAAEYGYEDGRAYIYARCQVASRRDLDSDELAGQRFRDMQADYRLWLKDAA